MSGSSGFQIISPPIPPPLVPFVESWIGYRQWCDVPMHRVERPDGRTVLILEWGAPTALGRTQRTLTRFRSGFFAGIDDQPTFTSFSGEQAGIEIKLSPAGAFALSKGAPREWTRLVAESSELGLEQHLCERLAHASTWRQRFVIVTRELELRLRNSLSMSRFTRRTLAIIDSSRGAVRVEQVSRELGVSRKHLHQRFAAEVGLSPKRYASVRQFHYASELLRQGDATLADVSGRAGYSDQAHLARAARTFGACTPRELSRWLAQPLETEVAALVASHAAPTC